jgi:AcrR family transcriptional regulator
VPAATPAASARSRNPRGQGERLRQELIDAASQLLVDTRADEPLSLRAVARGAGVAPQSVYLHFAGKGDLVAAVVADRFAAMTRAGDAAEATAGDPVDKLRARCLAYCEFGLRHPGHYRLLFDSRATGQLDPPAFPSPAGAAAYTAFLAAVQRCIQAGRAPADDAAAVTASLWAGLHGIVALRWSKPGFPWPAVGQLVERMLAGLVGIQHRPGPDEHPP